MSFGEIFESVGIVIEAVGVLVIVLGILVATARFAMAPRADGSYRRFRHDLGRGILLGLEFLVAADIIRTVATEPTLWGVLILGLIVLIRTFLSTSLEVEMEGRWPWRRAVEPARQQFTTESKSVNFE